MFSEARWVLENWSNCTGPTRRSRLFQSGVIFGSLWTTACKDLSRPFYAWSGIAQSGPTRNLYGKHYCWHHFRLFNWFIYELLYWWVLEILVHKLVGSSLYLASGVCCMRIIMSTARLSPSILVAKYSKYSTQIMWCFENLRTKLLLTPSPHAAGAGLITHFVRWKLFEKHVIYQWGCADWM